MFRSSTGIVVPHPWTVSEATQFIQETIHELVKRFGSRLENFSQEWTRDVFCKLDFDVTYLAGTAHVSISIEVRSSEIEIVSKVPLPILALLSKKRINKVIAEWADGLDINPCKLN